MTFKDIKPGQYFTIGETLSYPKVRTNKGYIDLRDDIEVEKETLQFDVRIMTDQEVSDALEIPFNVIDLEVKQYLQESNLM